VVAVEHEPRKIGLPPAGFSPRNRASPGGIEGLGVSSHTRASGSGRSHAAALRRATGNRIATLCRARSTASSVKGRASANGGFAVMLHGRRSQGASQSRITVPVNPRSAISQPWAGRCPGPGRLHDGAAAAAWIDHFADEDLDLEQPARAPFGFAIPIVGVSRPYVRLAWLAGAEGEVGHCVTLRHRATTVSKRRRASATDSGSSWSSGRTQGNVSTIGSSGYRP
jgi:hypothetical protein